MMELGQTDDPRELIPGSVEAVAGAAEQMRGRARRMEDVAANLAGVRIDDWDGPASSAFWDRFTPEAGQWRAGRDAMTTAAEALDSHASSLHWAQGQAAEAIALWRQGEQATQAAADLAAPVVPFGGNQLFADPFGGAEPLGSRPLGTEPPGTLAALGDPGAALRQEAMDLLARAREQLATAGDAHAATLEEASGQGSGTVAGRDPRDPRLGVDLRASEGFLDKAERQQAEGNRFARFGHAGEEFDRKPGTGAFSGTLVGDRVSGSLLHTDVRGQAQVGGVDLNGHAEARGLGGSASAGAGFNQDGLNAQAKVNAYVGQVSVDGSAQLGPGQVSGAAQGFVGAEAGAHGTIGTGGVDVGADAFAGAKAVGTVHGDLGGLGVGATGEAWAGAGAEVHAHFGQGADGSFHVGGDAGVGLGVGGKIGFDVTVDPGQLTDTVSDTFNDAASALNPFD
jgi:type VII secretion system ESX-1 substrate